ncbi:T9SS type A sorting domain-containing protein [Flavobacterium nackdongense]|uniref:T9SS type A sorting domain-containing protein n=2 Tax=Flavobacterium nackdongense TaxID=2547394 RepID=A0A4P6YJ43_9FLAO|nr:T9SS type A sorting domain-containing protein [Flavobacterium nackdongense]
MKKILFYLTTLLFSGTFFAQTITQSSGWLESAYVEWSPVIGADSYNVYYTGGGQIDKKIDTQLIRSYGTYFRADVLGLAAGDYSISVKPVTASIEGSGTTTASLTVLAHDRTGFAFQGDRVPGGYQANGVPKTGAVIFYITQNTKNTISATITGASTNPCVGFQNILYAIKKGKDTRPFIFRLVGNITDMTVMEGGDITIENANNPASYLTIEGVGNDAVVNGMGIRLKSASNIEVRNLGFMNCNSTAGDNVGMQQDNDHIWVHHCDMFYGDAGSDADQIKGDGALDNKTSTYCTFSYIHFWDNGKASLLGLSEGTTTGLYVTYHHNWFDHSDSRHPRVRYYSAHIYNNFFDGNAKYGSGSTLGSSLFIEGNYFRDCKNPILTSMQGTDIWNSSTQTNDPANMGTFSGEAGGTIKAFNNTFDASNGANTMRFVAYADPKPEYNIAGKINSTTDFDAYVPLARDEMVPNTVKSKLGANSYNNFDTDAALYVKNLAIDEPLAARDKTILYSGRIAGGDLKFTYNNAVDDASYLVNTAQKTALTNYATKMVFIQGETTTTVSPQTLITSTDNNQTVLTGAAITDMIFTWGGTATDATVSGLPASGITYIKDAISKTITISGTPTASLSFSITTSGTSGTPVNGTGTITLTTPGNQTLTLTSASNNNQTVATGSAISTIIYTWGGDATGATVTGLPASGISFVKDGIAKTITITGTPTAASTYFSIATTGTGGTSATGAGTITVTGIVASDQIHNFTSSGKVSSFYTIAGNMNSTAGSANYDGQNLTARLKIESLPTTTITYTTTAVSTLTLVFDPTFSGTIKLSVGTTSGPTTSYTAVGGIVTVPALAAATYVINKGSVANLYYIKTSYATLGLPQVKETSQLKLYPNPVSEKLYLSSDQKIENVQIYNLNGLLVNKISNPTESIDISHLTSGSYVVKVTTNKGSNSQVIIKK